MRNSRFFELAKSLGIKPEGLKRFHIQQLTQCREFLLETVQNAVKDRDGKPIFYTTLKRATRSGRTQALAVHYFNDTTGEMQNLNYVTAILLNQRLDAQQRYVIVRTKDFKHGKALIWALSKTMFYGKCRRADHIAPKEL